MSKLYNFVNLKLGLAPNQTILNKIFSLKVRKKNILMFSNLNLQKYNIVHANLKKNFSPTK